MCDKFCSAANCPCPCVQCTNRKGKSEEITAKFFIVATGCRPKYPNLPGVKEFGITRSVKDYFLFEQ